MQPKTFIWASMITVTMVFVLACSRPLSASPTPKDPTPAVAASTVAAGGCSIFPADNIWNTRVDNVPVHTRSDDYVATIGRDEGFHADFGSGEWDGGPIGIPYIEVPVGEPLVNIDYSDGWPGESDPGPFPIPLNAPVEGGSQSDGDRHVISLDRTNCKLYEIYYAFPQQGGWSAASGAYYDLNSHALRPDGWTSADAAGLPIFAGLVTFDEVASGRITHAIRFTAPETQAAYVWPARHQASDIEDLRYPPMGQRFRLRASYDISGFSPQMQVILRAMKEYGIILADNGSSWFFSGSPDPRWDNDVLHEIDVLEGGDMEAVDVSSLMLNPDSGQVRSTASYTHWTYLVLTQR